MEKYDVFISYKKSTGEDYAKHLKEALEEAKYSCFMAADLSILAHIFNSVIIAKLLKLYKQRHSIEYKGILCFKYLMLFC